MGWLEKAGTVLTRRSIVADLLRIHDGINPLAIGQVGMLLYNLRAVFLFLAGAAVLALVLLTETSDGSAERRMIRLMAGAWIADAVASLLLHQPVASRLRNADGLQSRSHLPETFNLYFAVDALAIGALVVAAPVLGVHTIALTPLLATIFVAYCVFSGVRRVGLTVAIGIGLVLFVAGAHGAWRYLHPASQPATPIVDVIEVACFVALAATVSLSTVTTAWIRGREHWIARSQIRMLGEFENILSGIDERHGEQRSEHRLLSVRGRRVLETLCTGDPELFWYRSGCVWVLEDHQDRGPLLLPLSAHVFPEAYDHKGGLPAKPASAGVDRVALLGSLERSALADPVAQIRKHLDAPAAFVPLRNSVSTAGMLALYGEPGGPPPSQDDVPFLKSLGAVIADDLDQWRTAHQTSALRRMDLLFDSDSLQALFQKAVDVLVETLNAKSCMLIRPDPENAERLAVVAASGFDESVSDISYRLGHGLTGAAALGQRIRIDDVSAHRDRFDSTLLKAVEKARRASVQSWMALPIFAGASIHGVIKVFDTKGGCPWFTADDEELGRKLATRLGVLIEKFVGIHRIEVLVRENAEKADEAIRAREIAEQQAQKRIRDLRIMTHQLSGSLSAVSGSISRLEDAFPGRAEPRHCDALVEDALLMCSGVQMTMALETGQPLPQRCDSINVATALRNLCERLRTAYASKLEFEYIVEEGFPLIRMNRQVFTNVFYSLIHNAFKYATPGTTVDIECGFEQSGPAIKVKSKGVRIDPSEREEIFDKFHRGRAVSKGKLHAGTGLGLWIARGLMRAIDGDVRLELSPSVRDLSVFVVQPRRGDHAS
jgi:signal transduction histidine kinase